MIPHALKYLSGKCINVYIDNQQCRICDLVRRKNILTNYQRALARCSNVLPNLCMHAQQIKKGSCTLERQKTVLAEYGDGYPDHLLWLFR